MNERNIYLFTLASIVVFCAFVGSVRITPNMESFENESNIIVSKRIAYIKQGMYNFFASSDVAFSKILSNVVFFVPNTIDIMCDKTMTGVNNNMRNNELCKNIAIVKSACVDNKVFATNEKRIKNAMTALGMGVADNNCAVRIFNNYYQIMTRSVLFENPKAIPNNTAINGINLAQLTLSGNIASIVLSRPVFMAFGTNGIYSVKYHGVDDVNKHAFAHYNSMHLQNDIFLEKINGDAITNTLDVNDTIKYTMYNKEEVNITSENVLNDLTPVALFYLNYMDASATSNIGASKPTNAMSQCVNMHFNNKTIDAVIANGGELQIPTYIDDTSCIDMINVKRNSTGLLLFHLMQSNTTNPIHTIKMPATFTPTSLSRYDIFFTYTFDVVILTIFGTVNDNDFCIMEHFKCNKCFKMDSIKLATSLQTLKVLTVNENTLIHDSVPNMLMVSMLYEYNI